MALLLEAGKQLDAVMSFKPLTGQQQCTCLAHQSVCSTKVGFIQLLSALYISVHAVPVSALCAGEHVVCVNSTQDEKCTETEDQKRPEKKQCACRLLVT